jgi:RNA polymerase sigma factor (sigma-70 family)
MLTTATSASLLEGLRHPANDTVWRSYVDRYRPVIVAFAMRLGLAPDDAEDAAQEILLEFSTAYREGKYDPQKGRLRSWLFGIARNQVASRRRRRRDREIAAGVGAGDSGILDQVPDTADPDAVWEEEWRRAILGQCLDEVRREVQPQTFEAFELFALREWPAERVAERLGITANAVFGAKRRVLQRAREILPLMEEIW